MKLILVGIMLILGIFAIHREYHDQPNCYLESVPNEDDSENTLLKKLRNCLSADRKTVKWRRSFIGSMIFLTLMCILVYDRELPSYREIILIVMIFYIVYYSMWLNYSNTITEKVSDIGKNIILRLRKIKRNV